MLMVRKSYERALQESKISRIAELKSLKQIIPNIVDHLGSTIENVGLELDEMPLFAKGFEMTLEKGMTFALEPKFVFDQGAVGIENTFALAENGVEKLNDFREDIICI